MYSHFDIADKRRVAVAWPSSLLLARWWGVVRKIRRLEAALENLDAAGLSQRSIRLRERIECRGTRLTRVLPQVYALASETISRRLDLRPYDAQLLGAIAMHHGYVAEMQTGEGKTLAATLPVCLNAMSRGGVHVATANDYLARRDAEWMRPVYESLGLSVGYIQNRMPRALRRKAYACSITYGTAKEFGFDYLRDRLLERQQGRDISISWTSETLSPNNSDDGLSPVRRQARFALVDEADSILIDEATTPLIISGATCKDDSSGAARFKWCAQVCSNFSADDHYLYDENHKTVCLTAEGKQVVRSLPKSAEVARIRLTELYEAVERAIKVDRDFLPDQQYVVRDGQVVIVDEFTGRLGEGRQWRNGIHQAVEAKEGLDVTVATSHLARITMPEFFSMYPCLAGMTGTAHSARREFRKAYGLPVVRIPTNRPCRRTRMPNEIFVTEEAKWSAIVDEVRLMHEQGRPVLVGTRTIDKSEHLSRLLADARIPHEVLNAKQNHEEARIVAEAGQRGQVTVATNMAGRGTDIRLAEGVADLGGLHVICTELHEAERIDRQLAGRCARQGDPGSFRQFLSLEDEILAAGFDQARAERVLQKAQRCKGPPKHLAALLREAQWRVELKRFQAREALRRFTKSRDDWNSKMGLDSHLDLHFS